MTNRETHPTDMFPSMGAISGLGLAFFGICTWASCAHWANFEYRTFDLAYYTQAVWQLLHGRFQVSLLGVPFLGNHVEPIVFLFAPLLLIVRHPLVFVFVQNAALASMGPIAFTIGQHLGLGRKTALLLAAALLVTPATGYVALHEFHPEALTAPFLLLMLRAHLRRALGAYWGWLLAVLACKENMALLIVAYCAVRVVIERKRPLTELRAWFLWPMVASFLWFLICATLITPALNSGNIDYLALYDRLGVSASDILLKTITQPQRMFGALYQSLSQGNLFWALLFPFLGLPLLRPHWLLIAAPILLQHLLSWRSSEWTIYFHYTAPVLPLFWIALAEGVAGIDRGMLVPVSIRRLVPVLVIAACVGAQILLGPARDIATTTANWLGMEEVRTRKRAFVSQIPSDASLLAPLPYLSHLAMREKLYSLHHVLKGLKTLSRATYSPPPPTDFVLIDYDDSATFDSAAGYYHPAMKTVDDRVIPSSDRLLHDFLQRSRWTVRASNELTLLRQGRSSEDSLFSLESAKVVREIATGTTLFEITKSTSELSEKGVEIKMIWNFQEPRDVFPWMFLKLSPRGHRNGIIISRGLCAPEATSGPYQESWHLTSRQIPEGDYEAEVLFVNNAKRAWVAKSGQPDALAPLLSPAIPLGEIRVATRNGKASQN